jgi:hypothetical protein
MFLFFYPSLKKQFIPKKKDQTIIYLNNKDLDTNKKNEKINNYFSNPHLSFKKNVNKNDNLIIKNDFKEFKKLKNNKFKTIFFTYLYTFNQLNNIRLNGNHYSNDLKQHYISSTLTMKNSSESYALILLYSFSKYSMFTISLHPLTDSCLDGRTGSWMEKTSADWQLHGLIPFRDLPCRQSDHPGSGSYKRGCSGMMISKDNTPTRHILKKPFQFPYQIFNNLNINWFFTDEFFFKIKLFTKKIHLKNDRFLKLNLKKKLHLPKYLTLIRPYTCMVNPLEEDHVPGLSLTGKSSSWMEKTSADCLHGRQRPCSCQSGHAGSPTIQAGSQRGQLRQLYNYFKTDIKENTAIIRRLEIIKNLNNLKIFNLMLNIIKNILKKKISSYMEKEGKPLADACMVGLPACTLEEDHTSSDHLTTIIINRYNRLKVDENFNNKIIIKIFDKVLNTLAIKTYSKELFEIKNLFLIKNLIKKSSNQTVSVLIQIINIYNRFFNVFKRNFNNTKHFGLNNYWDIYEYFNLKKTQSNTWNNFYVASGHVAITTDHPGMQADIIFSSKKFDTLIPFNSNMIIKWLNILKPTFKKRNYFFKYSINFFIKVKKKLNKRDNKNIFLNLSFYFNKQLWQLTKKKHNNKSLLWINSKYWFEISYKVIFFSKAKKRLPFTKHLVFSNLKENKKRFFFKNLLLKDIEKKQPQLIKIKTNVCLNL